MEVLREMLAQIFEGNAPACQAVGELLVERAERLKPVQHATETEPWRMVADAITQSIKGATVKEDPMSEGNAFVKRLRQIQAVHQPKVFDISQHDRDGLEKWTDHLLTFVQHVDPAAKGLCDLIQHLKWCTYPTGMYSSEERYQESFQQGGVLTRNLAEQNFLDLQYQLPEGEKFQQLHPGQPLPAYENLSEYQRNLDEWIYIYAISLFEVTSASEIVQFKQKALHDANFCSFVELILYVYSTKTRSAVHMWVEESEKLEKLPLRVPKSTGGAAVETIEGVLIQECTNFSFQRIQVWQRLASKAYQFFVLDGQKKAAEYIEKQVTECLEARDRQPDVSAWVRGACRQMQSERQFLDMQKAAQVAEEQHASPTLVAAVNTGATRKCEDCQVELPSWAKDKDFYKCTKCYFKNRNAKSVNALREQNELLKQQVDLLLEGAACSDVKRSSIKTVQFEDSEQGDRAKIKSLIGALKREKPISGVKLPSPFADEGKIPDSEWD